MLVEACDSALHLGLSFGISASTTIFLSVASLRLAAIPMHLKSLREAEKFQRVGALIHLERSSIFTGSAPLKERISRLLAYRKFRGEILNSVRYSSLSFWSGPILEASLLFASSYGFRQAILQSQDDVFQALAASNFSQGQIALPMSIFLFRYANYLLDRDRFLESSRPSAPKPDISPRIILRIRQISSIAFLPIFYFAPQILSLTVLSFIASSLAINSALLSRTLRKRLRLQNPPPELPKSIQEILFKLKKALFARNLFRPKIGNSQL